MCAAQIAGYYNCPDIWDKPTAELLRAAQLKGMTTSLNPQFDATETWAHLEDVLPHVSIMLLSQSEAACISRQSDKTSPRVLAEWFVERVRVLLPLPLPLPLPAALAPEAVKAHVGMFDLFTRESRLWSSLKHRRVPSPLWGKGA